MLLATLSNTPLKVTAVEQLERPKIVYNFAVENTHTYFVGNASLWVHNQCQLRVILRVLRQTRVYTPKVVPAADTLPHELVGMQKVSSYLGGREIIAAGNSQPGFDCWIGVARTGQRISLKSTAIADADNVVKELINAKNSALRANLAEQRIPVYIDAPNVEARSILNVLQLRYNHSPLNTIPHSPQYKNAIGDVIVFCKDGEIVHLGAL